MNLVSFFILKSMRLWFGIMVFCFSAVVAQAQTEEIDSLQQRLLNAASDIERVDILNRQAFLYHQISTTHAKELTEEALTLARQQDYKKGEADAYNLLGICSSIEGDSEQGLRNFLVALTLREELHDNDGLAKVLNNIGGLYLYQRDYDKALEYSLRSFDLLSSSDTLATGNAYLSLGMIYQAKGELEAALQNYNRALQSFEKLGNTERKGQTLLQIGMVHEEEEAYSEALAVFSRGIRLLQHNNHGSTSIDLLLAIANTHARLGSYDSARKYFQRANIMSRKVGSKHEELDVLKKTSNFFQQVGRYDSALRYHQHYARLANEIFTSERALQISMLEKTFETERKEKQLQLASMQMKEQNKVLVTVCVLLLISVIFGLVLFRSSRENRRINKSLNELNVAISEKNAEITRQAQKLAEAYEKIRQTNQRLEEEVFERTAKIQLQSKKIIEYTHFNSHKLRGPLARILGLVMLMDRESMNDELRELLSKLNISAQELDEIVREFTIKLDSEL